MNTVLALALLASHAADYTSTERCIHSATCKELNLPSALTHNPPGFMAYEATTAGVELWGTHILSKKHPKIARWSQVANISVTFGVSANNYRLAEHKVSR